VLPIILLARISSDWIMWLITLPGVSGIVLVCACAPDAAAAIIAAITAVLMVFDTSSS
jgi:hypothetical protein